MTTAKYIGMNRETGGALTDLDHIRQSVRDILLTPVGTRVMRRQYGSLLSALIDQPQNEALRLQIMSACYLAILKWEPRVKLTAISFESYINGAMVVELSGNRTDSSSVKTMAPGDYPADTTSQAPAPTLDKWVTDIHAQQQLLSDAATSEKLARVNKANGITQG